MTNLGCRPPYWGLMIFGTIMTLGMTLTAAQQAAPAATTSTRSGTYTTQQAEAGKAAYEEHCEGCHRSDFQGEQDAKPLAGMTFLNSWRGKSSDDLLAYISKAMPPNTPGAAGDEGNVYIVAYLLKANKVPAGAVPLGYESAVPIPAATPATDKN
jgi:mono/diheme cytochrome c family protein